MTVQLRAFATRIAYSIALLLRHRHRAGKAEADRADMGVRAVIPVIGRAAAEELALRVELAVDFETYNDIGVDHGFTACS